MMDELTILADALRTHCKAIALPLVIRHLNYPTQGPAAVALWQWLSSSVFMAASEAKRIYTSLGYVPFAGYPLMRS